MTESDAGDALKLSDQQNAVKALDSLLQTQEAQVLGAMGLIVGYVCVLFAKLLNATNPYYGVFGVALTTMLLLALSKSFDWRSPSWWARSVAVTLICILITSPQLYFAWKVNVSEAQAASLSYLREASQAAPPPVQPEIRITNTGAAN
jgi:hypothetical protein